METSETGRHGSPAMDGWLMICCGYVSPCGGVVV